MHQSKRKLCEYHTRFFGYFNRRILKLEQLGIALKIFINLLFTKKKKKERKKKETKNDRI